MGSRVVVFILFICVLQFSYATESHQVCNQKKEPCKVLLDSQQDLQEHETENFFSCEKIYISSADVLLDGNSIYVTLPFGAIKTSGIFADQRGLYFKDFKRQGDCGYGQWQCSDCGRCNQNYYIWCQTCIFVRK